MSHWAVQTRLGRITRALCLTILLGGLAIASSTHGARAQAPFTVSAIDILGNERIEPSTIQSYLTFGVGDTVTQDDLDQSLTALFRTGLFEDVLFGRQNSILIIEVEENPVINRIAFEGNRAIGDDALNAEVELRPRVVFTQTRVQNDTQRLIDLYRVRGYYAAQIEPVIIVLDQNRVDLVFEISEGPETGVQSIGFVGNEAFSDSTLADEITTSTGGFLDFLGFGDDSFDPDRLAFDEELLRRFYLSEGYADFRVISSVAELTPDREGFFITITVDEGPRYEFGEVQVISNVAGLDAEAFQDDVVSYGGDTYSNLDVEETIDNMIDTANRMQFPFAEIEPRVSRNREEQLINITYEVNEGPRVFVERIEIQGNVRTVDRVIRREMRLVEGDPLNSTLVRESERSIRDLGFFGDVELEVVEGSAPDLAVVRITVEERSTGTLSIGAGYSTTEGPVGDISLRERNLLGRGQDLRISATLAGESSQVDLSFTEPYFLGRDVAAGFDLFAVSNERDETGGFDEFTAGFGLRFGYNLMPDLRQTLSYRLEFEDITTSSNSLVQTGDAIVSSISQSLTYNQLDSRLQPTEGYILSGTTTFAGVGGDITYVRVTGSGSYYTPVLGMEDYILNVSAEAGFIDGLGDSVRVQDRFFVGGGNLRGFDSGGIGPRRTDTGQALGGNQFATGTVELAFPLGFDEELGIRGRVFTDVGWLTEVDAIAGTPLVDTGSIRASVGFGFSWNSPLGPLAFDFGFPIEDEPFDETEVFRFSFGTTF